MEVLSIKALHGPNIYHSRPVLIMKLNLGEFADRASNEIPGFNSRLLEILPGLCEHFCSPGHAGGFVERLQRGTYAAHIIEHIALSLSERVGIGVGFGKSVYDGEPSHYKVITRFKSEEGMSFLLRKSVECFLHVAYGKAFDIAAVVSEAKEIVHESSLGPTGQALADAAHERNIPVRRIGSASLLQLGWGVKRQRVQAAVSTRTGLIATELVQDKALTKEILQNAFVPVPGGGCARSEKEFLELLTEIPSPWAVKPLDGHHGQGVCLDLTDPESAMKAFIEAREYSPCVLIEEMKQGRDYRLLVVNGKLIAAAERTPAHVEGDGRSTIRELVDRANLDPRRGVGHKNVLTFLPDDHQTLIQLQSQGFEWHTVPPEGTRVLLRRAANLSTGGTARDVTNDVHPEVRELAVRVAQLVDLDICGIDLIHDDIRKPINASTAVIEVNAGPGLRMHIAPTEGHAQNVAGAIIESLFPNGDNGRIPIVAITGTNGKTTVARVLAHVLSEAGKCVGFTSSNGITIGKKEIAVGDTTGPVSAQAVLDDPRVEAAVLETARGGIMRGGLAYDEADVAIITNIREDHIGQDGLETLDDIVHVKALVAEQVRDHGTVVLNADDEQASRLRERAAVQAGNKKICFYSTHDRNPLIEESRSRGGCSYFNHSGWITECRGNTETRIVHVREIPFTFAGTSEFQVSNALAVVAAARSLGIASEVIADALKSFVPQTQNLGRGSLYKVGRGHVLIDYGHNTDAIRAVAQMVRSWKPRKLSAVLGLPGDRADELLIESSRVAAELFDRLILRDDYDRRGRSVGEVPLMALKTAEHTHAKCNACIVLDEEQAITQSIEELEPGDVAVVFYDELSHALSVLRKFDPQPIDSIPDFSEEELSERVKNDDFHTSHAHP
jgi:cyanophycin synthetase